LAAAWRAATIPPVPRPPLILASHKLAGLSGKVLLVRENAARLAQRGWRVTVAAQRLDSELLGAPGVACARVLRPPLGRRAETWWFTRRVAALARAAGTPRALVVGHGESLARQDVLHVHNAVHRAREALRGRGWTDGEEPPYARAQRLVLSAGRFRMLVANSSQVRDDLVARYGLAADRIAVVYPGHDPARFRPGAPGEASGLRAELGAGPETLLLGVITSGDFEKRAVGPFLEALGELPGELRARLAVVVVGKEAHPRRYLDLARAAGLDGRVRWLAPRPDVERLYQALDLYVHPAPFEEFGMSVLEAMACGRPVLTCATVGASELLAGAAREELLPSIEGGRLRDALARLCLDPLRRAALGAAGLAAARGATWEANVDGHERVYEEVAAELAAEGRGAPPSR